MFIFIPTQLSNIIFIVFLWLRGCKGQSLGHCKLQCGPAWGHGWSHLISSLGHWGPRSMANTLQSHRWSAVTMTSLLQHTHTHTHTHTCTHIHTDMYTHHTTWTMEQEVITSNQCRAVKSADDTDVVRWYTLSRSILGKINCSTFIIQHYFLRLELLAPYVRKGFLTE